jgi:parallel beta-helix repeat protein
MLWYIVLIALLGSICCDKYTVYVSTVGNDKWTGELATPNEKATDGPFKSIQRAQQHVRDLRSSEKLFKTNVVVNMLPGVYTLQQPLQFTPDDSGDSSKAQVIYQKYITPQIQGDAIISSCIPIENKWSSYQRGNITYYHTTLPQVASGGYYPNTLFINDQRRPRARSPTYQRGPTQGSISYIEYYGDDIKQYKNLQDANIILYHSWTASVHYIKSIDVNNRNVTLQNLMFQPASNFDYDPGSHRYYVENVIEELDQQGEWYLNRVNGELTYIPYEGEDINSLNACYPTTIEMLKIIGDFDRSKFVEHMQFQGLSFRHTDWYLNKSAVSDFQAAAWINTSAIYIRDARNIDFSNNDVQHHGYYGIHVERGCQDITLSKNYVNDLGAGGVRVGETTTTKYTTQRVNVIDNKITNGGNVFKEGVGILIHRTSYNIVSGNTVSYFRYTGINVGWSWDYTPADGAYKNQIIDNRIDHIGMHELNDLGGIYTLGYSNGTIIGGNTITNVYGYAFADWGIYLDQATTAILVRKNHISQTGSAGFNFHFGADNLVTENTILTSNTVDASITIGDAEPHLGFKFVGNTVNHNSEKPLIAQNLKFGGRYVSRANFVFDNNTYINGDSANPFKVKLLVPHESTFFFDWWQKNYTQDVHSIVRNM